MLSRYLHCLYWIMLQWLAGEGEEMGLYVCSCVFLLVLVAANSLLSFCCAMSPLGFSHKWHWLLRNNVASAPPTLRAEFGLQAYTSTATTSPRPGQMQGWRGGRFACFQLCLPLSNGSCQPMAAILLCHIHVPATQGKMLLLPL